MLTVLSPAKKLLAEFKPYPGQSSQPLFKMETATLIGLLRQKSAAEIAGLMDLSANLASLNFQRYQDFFENDCPADKAYPAVYYFQGDVYQGLLASQWSSSTLEFAQKHLMILSGLYGLLRPLDLIQAYRLEMGTRLANPAGETLYDYWRSKVTAGLKQCLDQHPNPLLINLASQEYSKVIDPGQLGHPMVDVHFYERKAGELKIIGIYAKKARGAMASYLMQSAIDNLESIKGFTGLGYQYSDSLSSRQALAFVR